MQACGWRTVLVLLLSLLLAAGTATAAPVTTLVVTLTSAQNRAAVIVGINKGIFEKYGLNIQLSPVGSSVASLKQVTDGTAQIGSADPAVMAQAMAQGAHLKSIFVNNGDATGKVPTDSFFAVVASKASGIREGHLEDLRGKKVGVPRGNEFHEYLFYALAAKGLDPQSAVTIVSTPPLGLPGALQGGSVDAIVANEPLISRALQLVDAIVVQRGGNYIQYVDLRVAASQYLATHPGTIKRFVTAIAEAAQYIRAHRDETADDFAQRSNPGDRAGVRLAVGFLVPDMRVSTATVQAAQRDYDFAIKIGALKQAPTFEEVFDLRILRQVEREHPEFFRDLPPIPDALRL